MVAMQQQPDTTSAGNEQPASPIGQLGEPGQQFVTPQGQQAQLQQQVQNAQDAGVPLEEYQALVAQHNALTESAERNQEIIDRLEQLTQEHNQQVTREQYATHLTGMLARELRDHEDAEDIAELSKNLVPFVQSQIDDAVEQAIAAEHAQLEEWHAANVLPYVVHYNALVLQEKYGLNPNDRAQLLYYPDWPQMENQAQQLARYRQSAPQQIQPQQQAGLQDLNRHLAQSGVTALGGGPGGPTPRPKMENVTIENSSEAIRAMFPTKPRR